MENENDAAVSIKNVAKRFGTFTALERVSLDIENNEFFTLLGPSGCGKTTLLRLIGGFETPSEGEITLYGQGIGSLPANRRSVNTVFQQYALFPHMTVAANVGFGMKMQNVPATQITERTKEALEMVQLQDFAHRKPNQLSGGQRQRVALARALAPKPKVLLLDEPLSALDLKLRQSMRIELKNIQRRTGITFIFVTHDQEEALTMSDRIAVMSAGQVQQIGTARDIYEDPTNAFVADFIGETNFIGVDVNQTSGDLAVCQMFDGSIIECKANASVAGITKGKVSVRPERLSLTKKTKDGLGGIVSQSVYIGTDTQYTVRTSDGNDLVVRAQNATGSIPHFEVGDEVSVTIDQAAARLMAG